MPGGPPLAPAPRVLSLRSRVPQRRACAERQRKRAASGYSMTKTGKVGSDRRGVVYLA